MSRRHKITVYQSVVNKNEIYQRDSRRSWKSFHNRQNDDFDDDDNRGRELLQPA